MCPDILDQQGRRLAHAAADAAGTEATPLAGAGHDRLSAALLADPAREAAREDAAVEEPAQLALDVGRQVAVAELGEEGLEVAGRGLVQGGLLWPVSLVSRVA